MLLVSFLMFLGSILMFLGSILMFLGSILMLLGSILMLLGTFLMLLGSFLMFLGSILMLLGTFLMFLGTRWPLRRNGLKLSSPHPPSAPSPLREGRRTLDRKLLHNKQFTSSAPRPAKRGEGTPNAG